MSIRMSNGDLERDATEEEIGFLPRTKPNADGNMCNSSGGLLSREDLLNLDKKEPKWRRLRIILLVLFWFIWIGLLVASIVIIVLSPRCPAVPNLTFWQSKVGYWVDPFAFRDSTGDLVGDFKGLIAEADYVKNTVGAGFLIVDRFSHGQYTNDQKQLGLTSDYSRPDEALGTMDEFRAMIKAYHRIGVEVVVTFDFNSVSKTSNLINVFEKAKPLDTSVSRVGGTSIVTIDGSNYYSAFGPEFVDLDLGAETSKAEIKKIIENWFAEGVDGILLANAAFYFEGTPNSALFSTNGNADNEWFKKDPSRQIFQAKSFEFVQEVRVWVDEISKKTGKPKLLAVDAGNTGYGITNDDLSAHFLGTEENPGAHLVVSRQFVKDRGWKFASITPSFMVNSVQAIRVSPADYEGRLALTTATPSDRHVGDLVSLASTFLLPGTALIYYGAELGQQYTAVPMQTIEPYPRDRKPMVDTSKNDNEWVCHLPMPWDQDGTRFSSSSTTFGDILKTVGLGETVETATAAGRGEVALRLVQELVALQKQPSFQWGKLEDVEQKPPSSKFEIFQRKAEGYPAFVNVLIRQADNFAEVIRFPPHCKSLRLRLAYPSLPGLELNQEVHTNVVYIKVDAGPAVYVFECNDI